MDYVRLYEESHLKALIQLNEIVQDEFEDYPYHSNWINKAIEDLKSGNRIAFGAIFADQLVGSVIVKDSISSDLELKNFIVNKNIPEIDVIEVRDNLLLQVEIFAQRNDYEIFTIDVLTKQLSDLNYFLSRHFTVSHLKQNPNKDSANIYTLTKEIKTIYNGDPLDFQSIVHWILKRQYNFELKSFDKTYHLPIRKGINSSKYTFSIVNSLGEKNYSITGEAIIFEFIDEDKKNTKPFDFIQLFESSNNQKRLIEKFISDSFSEHCDVRLVFDSRKLKTEAKLPYINYFSRKNIFKILGHESIPVKIPFEKAELGGALFYVDEEIKKMYFPDNPGFFPDEKIIIYLTDGYGNSLNLGHTLFFVEKAKDGNIVLLGKAEISATFPSNYETIYRNLKGSNRENFFKSNPQFDEAKDGYSANLAYWNFLTSFHRTSKNRKSETTKIIALALEKFCTLKNENTSFPNSLSQKMRAFVDSDKRESFTGITYLNLSSVSKIKNNFFRINDVTNINKNTPKIKFTNPNRPRKQG